MGKLAVERLLDKCPPSAGQQRASMTPIWKARRDLFATTAKSWRFRHRKGDLGRRNEGVKVVRLCKENKEYNESFGWPNYRE